MNKILKLKLNPKIRIDKNNFYIASTENYLDIQQMSVY